MFYQQEKENVFGTNIHLCEQQSNQLPDPSWFIFVFSRQAYTDFGKV